MARAGDGKARSDKRRRNNLIQKRLTDDELADFIERSQAAGFADHREYHSALVLGDAGFDRRERHDLIRVLGQLGKHGSNLNQIARAINSGKLGNLSGEHLQKIDDARKVVSEAAQEIRGILK